MHQEGLNPHNSYLNKGKSEAIKVRFIAYNQEQCSDEWHDEIDSSLSKIDGMIDWIQVYGIHDSLLIHSIGDKLKLHPLLIEDVMSSRQRPKVDDYGDHLYIVLRVPQYGSDGKIDDEQISIILGKHYVITFMPAPCSIFEPLIDRIKASKGIIRKQGTDFLAYAIIDTIVDQYFEFLEKSNLEIEHLESIQTKDINPRKVLPLVHNLRQEMIILRKSIWPVRELVARLQRDDIADFITSNTRLYLKDVYDHSVQIIDTIDALRDLSRGLLDVCLAQMSFRMNEIIKILTVVGTIFIPLTFITSYYGMNFHNMPELDWQYGYIMVIMVMLGITISMLYYFKRKKWF